MPLEEQAETVPPGVRLLTATEVLAVTRGVGALRLSRAAFLRFVAKGIAPQLVLRRGGEPLWDANAIKGWAEERLQPLLEDEIRDQILMERRGRRPNPTPELRSVSLDPYLPTHEAVLKAEIAIDERVRYLRDTRARLHADVERLAREPEGDRDVTSPRWRRRRVVPTRTERHATAVEALADVERRLRADTDLLACRAWLHELLGWAQVELGVRIHRLLDDGQLAREELARADAVASLARYPTASAFAKEDPRRRSWASASATDEVDLGGSDHGQHWRLDFTESATGQGSRHRGTWRVSWLAETGELYAFDRASGAVLLIGRFPRADSQQVCDWITPMTRQMSERNSLAVVVEAFRSQERACFVAFGGER